jgi:signal transduction histidine kinase
VLRVSFVLYFLNCKASLLSGDASSVWTPRRGSGILITYAIATGCEVYSQLVNNTHVSDSLYIAMIAFYLLSGGLFTVCFLLWLRRNLYFIFSDTHTHQSTYFCCFVYSAALIFTVLVETGITCYYSDNSLHSYSIYHTMANGSRNYSVASLLIITNTVFILATTHMARNYSNIDSISANAEVRCKHTFVRYVSHAIRSPMAVIKGGLDVLESILLNKDANIHYTPEEVERNKILLDIKLSCDYSVTLLNNLLTLDKIEVRCFKLTVFVSI